MTWWREVGERPGPGHRLRRGEEEGHEDEELLRGTAPWGFTLRDGAEPLLITKVEEGSLSAVCLQPGDKRVSVKAVPLSGSRQEALCLVKGSLRTQTLGVPRRHMMN